MNTGVPIDFGIEILANGDYQGAYHWKGNTMNTTELTRLIAKKHELPQAKVAEVIADLFGEIKTSVSDGNYVAIKDFGRFSKKTREAREGRNPATGEKIQIGASSTLHFKASKGE